ncbi:MAG: TraR/DksA family transcriptional regulator [Pyrinomonadaceae bacterium]
MSKLKAKEAKEIRDKLLAERELLIQKLNGNDLSIDDSETPDPVDLAVRNYSKNVMLAVSENESRQLALIDEALLRVEDKEYGDCQNCGKPVNPKRLSAIPWARYCLECQELVEQGLLDEETV